MADKIKIHEANANAGLAAGAKGNGTYEVLLINPGMGSSGYYSAEVLQESGPKAFPGNTKSFLDHAATSEEWERPARSVQDILGVYPEGAYWSESGGKGPGLYAKLKVRPSMEQFVDEVKDYVGMSISAMAVSEWGETPEGDQAPIITELIAFPFNSVDMVTVAGRGGAIGAAMESADVAYLTEHGVDVPSAPKTPPVPQGTPPEETHMPFTPAQEAALVTLAEAAPAITTGLAALQTEREAREAAARAAAEVNPLTVVTALTIQLAESGLTLDSQKDVIADIGRGMPAEEAIARWKAIEGRTAQRVAPARLYGVVTQQNNEGSNNAPVQGAPRSAAESLAALQSGYHMPALTNRSAV